MSQMDELGHGRRKRVLLGVTGSVAAIKVHQICQALLPVVDVPFCFVSFTFLIYRLLLFIRDLL